MNRPSHRPVALWHPNRRGFRMWDIAQTSPTSYAGKLSSLSARLTLPDKCQVASTSAVLGLPDSEGGSGDCLKPVVARFGRLRCVLFHSVFSLSLHGFSRKQESVS